MADKPEIFLEVGAGFFRIPTAEANYNITILGQPAGGSVPPPAVPAQQATNLTSSCSEDDYYQHVSEELYQDIGHLAKSLSSTILEIPAEDRRQQRASLDEAGEKLESAKTQLRDIVSMTERAAMEIMDNVEKVQGGTGDVQALLSELKNHPAFAVEGGGGDEGQDEEATFASQLEELESDIATAINLLGDLELPGSEAAVEPEDVPASTAKRYLFELDTIFQTLYELCTNETVKDHIAGAREKAGDIFALTTFQDKISEKASVYEADEDNYFNVPMTDVFQSLFAACSDKGIKNLLKKMDAGQSTIFLDQAIPLEVPAVEDVGAPGEEKETAAKGNEGESSPQLEKLVATLGRCQGIVHGLPESAAAVARQITCEGSVMSLADQHDIFAKIESAFAVSSAITADVSRITEALSFQDLSGQRIMKILKLLSDFQVELLAIVVSFGSQLKHKKDNVSISVEESKTLAQEDVDRYLGTISGEEGEEGMLDQETVNQMLEEFGF